MSIKNIPSMVELSSLSVTNRLHNVKEMCTMAKAYNCAATTVHPCYLSFTQKNTIENKNIANYASISYPVGGDLTAVKIYSAKQTELLGASGINVLMNMSAFLSGNYKYVKQEIEALCKSIKVPVTIVVEISELNHTEVEAVSTLLAKTDATCIQFGTCFFDVPVDRKAIEIAQEYIGEEQSMKIAGKFDRCDDLLAVSELGVEMFSLNYAMAQPLFEEIDQQLKEMSPDIK